LSKESLSGCEDPFDVLNRAVNSNNELTKEGVIGALCGSDEYNPSDAYLAGFIEGAQTFFEEVRHKI
jgi:hypothetical protein